MYGTEAFLLSEAQKLDNNKKLMEIENTHGNDVDM